MTPNIQCINLCKSYHSHHCLVDASLTLKSDTITGILGANGAGKSTLIKCILKLIQPTSGSISLNTVRIGYLPELAQLPVSISAREIIHLALRLAKTNLKETSNILKRVQLEEQHWHKPLRNYSKGMRQRVALAYAMAGDPQWLILDEPMSGLDALGRKQFLDILLDMHAHGTGILICSHIVPDLVRLCDQVIMMNQGKIIETVPITNHSMDEASMLENKLMQAACMQITDTQIPNDSHA